LNWKKPVPNHISILTGALWLDELINNPKKVSFYENLGMNVPAFMRLKDLLEDQGALYDSKYFTATKKNWESWCICWSRGYLIGNYSSSSNNQLPLFQCKDTWLLFFIQAWITS
jgi:hypothetical protein